MAYTQDQIDAINRLQTLYNGDAYNAGTNPGGLAEGGHRQNFEPALADVATAGAGIGSEIDAIDAPDLRVRSEEFRARFLGNLTADPVVDGNGNPVDEGELYWNTAANELRVYNGTNWVVPVSNAADYVPDSGGAFTGPVSFQQGLSGNVTGDVTGNLTGNADTASTLQTARTISVSGDVSGSVSFDGAANVDIAATVADDSHAHTLSTITDAGTMALQNANAVSVTGGAIDGTAIGGTTPAAVAATTLDASGAVNMASSLDVTGAAALQSTLGVTGASTFTAATTHNGGINADSLTGLSGPTIVNAPAGQPFEVHVGGVKKAEVTSDGDVIAERFLLARQSVYFRTTWTGGASDNAAIADSDPNITISVSDVVDPFGAFERSTGEFTAPVDGVYLFSWLAVPGYNASFVPKLSLQINSGAGFVGKIHALAQRLGGTYADRTSISAPIHLATGDRARLYLSQAGGNNRLGYEEGETLFSGVLIG